MWRFTESLFFSWPGLGIVMNCSSTLWHLESSYLSQLQAANGERNISRVVKSFWVIQFCSRRERFRRFSSQPHCFLSN
ncbi:hypothetical protein BGZ60DRAFT_229738 [Tricladium varicosporioides]|nr:hypothetical protein BGZ60DRAFT_229738 [Hymenoscyphus varicosporioides]